MEYLVADRMQVYIWKREPDKGSIFNWVVTAQHIYNEPNRLCMKKDQACGLDQPEYVWEDNVNFLKTRKEALKWAREVFPGVKKRTQYASNKHIKMYNRSWSNV